MAGYGLDEERMSDTYSQRTTSPPRASIPNVRNSSSSRLGPRLTMVYQKKGIAALGP